MPAILPRDPRQLVEFARLHAPVWQETAPEMGLSPQQIAAALTATAEGEAAWDAAYAARQASLTATQAYYSAAAKLRSALASCLATVRATSAAAGTTNAYQAAQVPPPRTPGRSAGSPAQPTDLAYELHSGGELRITWKCRQPRGVSSVVWFVSRRLPGESAFRLVDAVGEKFFIDRTLPSGVELVEYAVQGRRGGSTGPMSNTLQVQFGSVAQSQSSTNTTTTAAKLAA